MPDMNDLLRGGFARAAAGRQPVAEDAAPRPAPIDGGAREHSTPPRPRGINQLIRQAAEAATTAPAPSVIFAGPVKQVHVRKENDE
jgi:hypothetical protein